LDQNQPAQEGVSARDLWDTGARDGGRGEEETEAHRAPRWGSPESRATWEITREGRRALEEAEEGEASLQVRAARP
jgi:hypothetical protein